MKRWIGKVAIVTGASSGIGEAISKAFTIAGINVVALARREERLQTLCENLKEAKGSLHPVKCNLREESDILKAFQYTEEKFGGIDILVNNAGISSSMPIIEESSEALRATLEVNVLAAAICSREAIRLMRKRKTEGHIFNIISVLGLNATLSSIPIGLYPASKFALHAMTDNLRQEVRLAKDNIKVTGIYPGLVKTEIIDASGGDARVFDVLPHIQSEHIAESVIYALSAPGNVQVETIKITPLHQKL